ncbi:hypothetical protein JCM33374_g6420 [Metschnikowia sp. JCM 33374]|nr:hypothetical protein JCM33374_g6420 [Metschnikowia sp. JCM 33374]
MKTDLVLQKTSHPETCTKKTHFSGIFRFASRSDLPLLALGSMLIILSAVASPMQTIIYGKIFDRLARFLSGEYNTVHSFLHELRALTAAMMGIAGARLVFAWLGISVWLIVGENSSKNARSTLFESLLTKDIEWLSTKENLIGSLTLIFRCIEEIRCGISENLGLFVQTIASVSCLFVIAMMSSWSLTLIICCSIPLSALSSWVFGSLTAKYATQENLKNAQASKILDWCFVCGDTVRVLNGKIGDLVKFSHVVDASAVAYTNMALAISANSAVLKLLSNLVVVGGLAFGEHLIKTGKLGLGDVITAFSACVLFGTEISSVGDIVALLNKAQASSNTIDTLEFDMAPTAMPPLHSSASEYSCFSQKTPCKSLALHNLTFRYRNTEVDVIDHITGVFSSSRLNFVVGESGSGKSTVASLLSGFLDKTGGDLLVDSLNFDFLSPDWFTENVCFVESRPLVFERSLADNLLLGTHYNQEDARTRGLLEEACSFADLSEYVKQLPKKLDTVLVSSKLSGGQIQKIGLARAWIANRPILILDEALGSINQKSKAKVMENIRVWRKDYLTIIISHDLTDVCGEDSVLVMEKGHVKAYGVAAEMRDLLPKTSGTTTAVSKHTQSSGADEEDDEKLPKSASEKSAPYDYLNNPAILRDLESKSGDSNQLDLTHPMGLFEIVAFCYRTTDNKFLILLGLLCSLLAGIAMPGLSYCFAEVLSVIVKNAVAPGPGKYSVLAWCLIIVAVAVGDSVVTFGSRMALQFASEKWILKLRKLCLAKINDQAMTFFAASKPSYLNTLLMNDTRDLRNLISEFLSGLLLVVALTMLGLVWAIVIGWKLALVGMSFVPLVFLVTVTYSVLLRKYETTYKDHVADAEKFSQEVVSAMRTVRSFGLARQLSAEYEQKLHRLHRAGCKRAVAGGFGIALSELCGTAATSTVLYYGMYLIVRHEYNQKQMIQVLTMLTFTVASASYLMKSLPEITRGQRAGTLITRILSLGDSPVECGGEEKHHKSGADEPVVEFKNVCFSYSDPQSCSFKPVLRGTEFSIYQGEAIVIAGECGSGKSTITSLMLRLYQQDRGIITYRGKDISTYDPEWYRSSVTLVSQEPMFFEASVLENLLYGMNGSQRVTAAALVEECLRATNSFDFIDKLPQKLHTVLGKDSSFSSGQLQRLSIARVLLRKPKVVVFDEPTSRLDSENTDNISSLIFRRLHEYDPTLTTIVVTHDPRVMAQASRVLMVQNGCIAEEGTFDELVKKQGSFSGFMK